MSQERRYPQQVCAGYNVLFVILLNIGYRSVDCDEGLDPSRETRTNKTLDSRFLDNPDIGGSCRLDFVSLLLWLLGVIIDLYTLTLQSLVGY